MIFSSRDRRRSYGGYDLWYSLYSDGKWSRPLNLGNRINTNYDDKKNDIINNVIKNSMNNDFLNDNHILSSTITKNGQSYEYPELYHKD